MFQLTLSWPDKNLFPNKRGHWSKVYGPKKRVRKETHDLCLEAGVHRQKYDPQAHYSIHWDFYPPDKRKRDDDNLEGAMKWHRDAIANCMKVDDNNFTATREVHSPVMAGMVVVTIKQIRKEKTKNV